MIARILTCAALLVALALPGHAQDDDVVFIQLEARTSLAGAQESVRSFVEIFEEDVNGFSLGGGWYGVALGPYTRAEAQALLIQLRRTGQVPSDAYIELPTAYGQQFWPIGAQAGGAVAPRPAPIVVPDDSTAETAEVPAEPVVTPAAPEPVVLPEPEVVDETPREARASEALLSRDERKDLQIALQWAGFYKAAIDGAYGRGTRNSMAQWQEANGYEVTGILTTLQRAELLRQYNAILDGMDMADVTDARAGIAMQMPTGVVAFDRYEAPFAIFNPTGDLDARVLLISQPGDRQTMAGLYEIMQTLEIVPFEGERSLRRDGFLLTGENSRITSHTEVSLRGGEIKGFTLIWPAGDEERRARVLGLMQNSFARLDGVLDPAAVTDDGQAIDLVAGLRVRTPRVNASGFFVNNAGLVLTSAAAVGSCGRVTLNEVHIAQVVAQDATLGLALLRPEEQLAPGGFASFLSDTPRLQSEIAVAGYSFGGKLPAPTLTFGTLEDLRGLGGEETLKRLALSALPGDEGGPVFDGGGVVMGMLLPATDPGGRRLPEGVSFAAKSADIIAFLRANGVSATARGTAGTMAPEDMTAQAAKMTVLVGCWD
jgi:peptidoglycan hydrolase-like protein with peptidoglycan-binding domain